jgi:hypothetical protein
MKPLVSVSTLFFVLALPSYVGAQVVISEIMYDLPGADTGPGGEWVEIHNESGSGVDLEMWTFLRRTQTIVSQLLEDLRNFLQEPTR